MRVTTNAMDAVADVVFGVTYDLQHDPPKIVDAAYQFVAELPPDTDRLPFNGVPLFLVEAVSRMRVYRADPRAAIYADSSLRERRTCFVEGEIQDRQYRVMVTGMRMPWASFYWPTFWSFAQQRGIETTTVDSAIGFPLIRPFDRSKLGPFKPHTPPPDLELHGQRELHLRIDGCAVYVQHEPVGGGIRTQVTFNPIPGLTSFPCETPLTIVYENQIGTEHLRGVTLSPEAYRKEQKKRRSKERPPVWERMLITVHPAGDALVEIDGRRFQVNNPDAVVALQFLKASQGRPVLAKHLEAHVRKATNGKGRAGRILKRPPSGLLDHVHFPMMGRTERSGYGYALKERSAP
jgi:hypothetical protein